MTARTGHLAGAAGFALISAIVGLAVSGEGTGRAGAAQLAAPTATSVPTTIAGQTAPTEFDALGFFTELFRQLDEDPVSGDLDEWLVPGSPAAGFVTYLLGFATARRDNPQEDLPSFEVAVSGGSIEACVADFCDVFSDFRVDDGRLAGFRLNGAVIDSRVGAASKPVSSGSLEVEVLGAFERISVNELAVVIAVESYKDVTFDWEAVTLVDATGVNLTVDVDASSWPEAVATATRHVVVVQFPGGRLGSDLIVTYTSPTASEPVEVRIAVDELARPIP